MAGLSVNACVSNRRQFIQECLRPGVALRNFVEESIVLLLLLLPKSIVVKRIKRRLADKVYGCSESEVFLYKSGRAALRALMDTLKIMNPQRSVVFVPDYVCNVVGDACVAAGFNVREYPTTEKYLPEWATLDTLVAGQREPIVILCSQFGATPILEPEAEILGKKNPRTFFVADECQNLINDSLVKPRRNRAIIFSFNHKTCPGVMGGGLVLSDEAAFGYPVYSRVEFPLRFVCSVALFRQWLLRNLTLLRRVIRLSSCQMRNYDIPKSYDYSICNRPHYDFVPEPIYKISASRALVSLRMLDSYCQLRNDNARALRAGLAGLHVGIQADVFLSAPPFLPVMAGSKSLPKIFPVPVKSSYGRSPSQPLKSSHGCSLMINQSHLAYKVADVYVSQLTSQHSITDNRILHCMARSAEKAGYQSEVAGPATENSSYGNIKLISCSVIEGQKRPSLLIRHYKILKFALKAKRSLFQIHDPDLLPVGLLLKLLRRLVVYDVHDDYEASFNDRLKDWPLLKRLLPRIWWFFERNAARVFDGITVADRHLAEKFAHCDPVILGNYPRIDFTPKSDTRNERTFNLIYVGGVTTARGLEMALKALQLLPMPELRLHVIGEGRDSKLMAQLRAEPRVVMHGRVPWSELHKYYTRAHLGLALYQPLDSFLYCPGENAVKVLEYMAAGIPVLCSNFPGLKAFVEDSGCGLGVQPDDPEMIAIKIKEIFEDNLLREQLGSRGRYLFETQYNWEKNEFRLVQLYEKILGI